MGRSELGTGDACVVLAFWISSAALASWDVTIPKAPRATMSGASEVREKPVMTVSQVVFVSSSWRAAEHCMLSSAPAKKNRQFKNALPDFVQRLRSMRHASHEGYFRGRRSPIFSSMDWSAA